LFAQGLLTYHGGQLTTENDYVMEIQRLDEIVGGKSPYHELRYGAGSIDISGVSTADVYLFAYTAPASEINRKDLIKIADEFNIRNAGDIIDQTIAVKNDYLRSMSVEYNITSTWHERIFTLTKSIDKSISI
jgi:hypothetical protein